MRSEGTMQTEQMAEILERYVEAVNQHDVEAMLDLRHPDAYLELMGVAPPIEGKGALRTFYTPFFGSLMRDYKLEIAGTAFGEDTAVVWGRYSARVAAGFLGTDASGGPVEVPVCFVCTFADGMFLGDHMYADALAPARQTGASVPPPAPG
jgi:ketosteroid isomerase-like protein